MIVKQYSGRKLQLNLLGGKYFFKNFIERGSRSMKEGAREKHRKLISEGTLIWHWRVLKLGKGETGKNPKFRKPCTGRGFNKVIHNVSFFEHPWPSESSFYPVVRKF